MKSYRRNSYGLNMFLSLNFKMKSEISLSMKF